MFDWVKNKLGVIALEEETKRLKFELESEVAKRRECEAEIIRLETSISYKAKDIDNTLQQLHRMTVVDADVGVRGNNTIIMTGVLHGKAFVNFYDLGDGEFREMVEQLRYMKKHHFIRNIDAPMFDFKGSFDI